MCGDLFGEVLAKHQINKFWGRRLKTLCCRPIRKPLKFHSFSATSVLHRLQCLKSGRALLRVPSDHQWASSTELSSNLCVCVVSQDCLPCFADSLSYHLNEIIRE